MTRNRCKIDNATHRHVCISRKHAVAHLCRPLVNAISNSRRADLEFNFKQLTRSDKKPFSYPQIFAQLEQQQLSSRVYALLMDIDRDHPYSGKTERDLREMGSRIIPHLIKRLVCGKPEIQWRAALALGYMRHMSVPTIPYLTMSLRNPSARVRRFSIEALSMIGRRAAPLAMPELVRIATDRNENAEVRICAIEAVKTLIPSTSRIPPPLLDLLVDPDKNVRRAARKMFEGIGKIDIPLLASSTRHPSCLALSSVDVLNEVDPNYESHFARALRSGSVHARYNAAYALSLLDEHEDKTTRALGRALYDRSPIVRYKALRAFVDTIDRPRWIWRRMVRLLKRDQPLLVRAAAADIMSTYCNAPKFVIRALVRAIGDPSFIVRGEACRGLIYLDDKAVPFLIPALRSRNLLKRLNAAYVLGKMEYAAESFPALRRMLLRDKSARAREQAAWALGEHADDATSAIPTLFRTALKDKSIKVRKAAIDAIGNIGVDADVAKKLLKLTEKAKSPTLNHDIVDALAKGDDYDVEKLLVKNLDHSSAFVRAAALGALGKINDKKYLKATIKKLSDKDVYVRKWAAYVLGTMKQAASPAVPHLKGMLLKEKTERAKMWAARALAEIGKKSLPAKNTLIAMLGHSSWEVRKWSARAIGNFGDKASSSEQTLAGKLLDHYSQVRAESARSLGRIGAKDKLTLFLLLAACGDKYFLVRKFAVEALEKSAPKPVKEIITRLDKLFPRKIAMPNYHAIGSDKSDYKQEFNRNDDLDVRQSYYIYPYLTTYNAITSPKQWEHFFQVIKKTPARQRLALARFIFRNKPPALDSAAVDNLAAKFFAIRKQHLGRRVMDRNTTGIIYTHEELKYSNYGISRALEMFGVSPRRIIGRQYKGSRFKRRILRAIAYKRGKIAISSAGHGGRINIELSKKAKESLRKISYKELGDALLKRQSRGEDLGKVFISSNSCMSYNFAINLYEYLLKKGAKNLPTFYAESNDFAIANHAGDATRRASHFLVGKKGFATLGDIIEYHDRKSPCDMANEDDGAFFVPYRDPETGKLTYVEIN